MILEVDDLHWLKPGDLATDLCAHGSVTVQIGGISIAGRADGPWCVSAAALHLLRTLTAEHTRDRPVGDQLIPRCGHLMLAVGAEKVEIWGCKQSIDWEVRHAAGQVLLRAEGGAEERLAAAEWRRAVLEFADAVDGFYAASRPRQPQSAFEQQGFAAFRAEWTRRRRDA